MAVRIIADSVSDIPKALADQLNIQVLPLTVNFNDGSYRDGIDLTNEEFFKKLKASDKLPTTSQVTPGIFMEAFQEAIDQGDEVVGIFMSGKLSGTYQAAETAKQMVGSDRIYLIDSGLVTYAIGQIVVALARMAKNGAPADYLYNTGKLLVEQTKCRFIVDTLENLTKGGRLKPAEALVGSLLNIKPILTMIDGELKAAGKARGRKKALKLVLDYIEDNGYDLNNKLVGLYHAVDQDYMFEVKEALLAKYPHMLLEESEVGSVVGTHSGPGCVAMSFIDVDLEDLDYWR